MRLIRATVFALALVAVGCSGGSSDTSSRPDTSTSAGSGEEGLARDIEAALSAAFEESFSESGASGAVAAVRTSEGTWIGNLGVADLASSEARSADVHQRIGSVTKTFTVGLLLQAAADGLLSLDDTIYQYVDGVLNGGSISLHQLAGMPSGVASYTLDEQFQEELFSDPERVWTPEELVQVGIEDSPVSAPGAGWQYSNTNTVLLGLVLEQATGKPIGDLYRERIIEPLGLRETSFPDADPALPEPHARGHTLQGRSDRQPANATDRNPARGWTAGEMVSTVEDLLVYGWAPGTGEGILTPEQQAERLDSFFGDELPPNTPDKAYGLGFGNERGWLGHTDTQPGFGTIVYYHPKLDTTVVVSVNRDIASGDCPEEKPTLTDGSQDIPCADPATRIFEALAEALGQPFGTD